MRTKGNAIIFNVLYQAKASISESIAVISD